MPLIRNGRFVSDDWLRPAAEDKLPWYGKVILPRDRLSAEGPALLEAGHTLGVEIANDTPPEDLDAWLPQLTLIAIGFPKSADGRGFSIAQRLRRMGYKGELRAVGHLIPDQYSFALSCGFDTVEISEALAARQPEMHWQAARQSMSLAYQASSMFQRNILTMRWGNREA